MKRDLVLLALMVKLLVSPGAYEAGIVLMSNTQSLPLAPSAKNLGRMGASSPGFHGEHAVIRRGYALAPCSQHKAATMVSRRTSGIDDDMTREEVGNT